MSSRLPPLKLDAREDQKNTELDSTGHQSDCSSVGSEVNLIDDRTPSKADINDTPLTKLNLVALGSSVSPQLNYRSARNILGALALPFVFIGYVCIFQSMVGKSSEATKRHTFDFKIFGLGSCAYIFAECFKACIEWAASAATRKTLDGEIYPWGTFGLVLFVSIEDFLRLVFAWYLCTTYSFLAAFSFGLGWVCVEVLFLLASFSCMCCNLSFTFSEATILRRMLARTGIKNYSFHMWIQHFFSVAGSIGASLVAFKIDNKLIIFVVFGMRMIGYIVQNECLRRRCNVSRSSIVLFALQVSILLVGLALWQWGAVVLHSSTVAAAHVPSITTTPIPSTTKHKKHHGHHHNDG